MSTALLIRDHLKRIAVAARGFEIIGWKWIMPFLVYAGSPAISRLKPKKRVDFATFSTRLGECDIYTFANLFGDYPLKLLRQSLLEVTHVIDVGANVGAFSWLALKIAGQSGRKLRVAAIEPSEENVQFLRSQPFAVDLDILHGAVGANDGFGKLITGINSVTHTVEPAQNGVPVHSLQSLCTEPVLLKMDIEGGEFHVLRNGLPDNVRTMFLEWHSGPETDRPEDPTKLIPRGHWQCVSRDLYGSSTWYWNCQ